MICLPERIQRRKIMILALLAGAFLFVAFSAYWIVRLLRVVLSDHPDMGQITIDQKRLAEFLEMEKHS